MYAAVDDVDIAFRDPPVRKKRAAKNVVRRRRDRKTFVITETVPNDAFRRKPFAFGRDLFPCPRPPLLRLEGEQLHLVPALYQFAQIWQHLRLHQRLPHPEITNVKRLRHLFVEYRRG